MDIIIILKNIAAIIGTCLSLMIFIGGFNKRLRNWFAGKIKKFSNDEKQNEEIKDIRQDISNLSGDIQKISNSIEKYNKQVDILQQAIVDVLRNDILCACNEALNNGNISATNLQSLINMHMKYHDELDGNGYVTKTYNEVMKLPVKDR